MFREREEEGKRKGIEVVESREKVLVGKVREYSYKGV